MRAEDGYAATNPLCLCTTFQSRAISYTVSLTKTRSSATAEKQRVSCPHGGGLGPAAHSPAAPSGYTYAYGRIWNPQQTYVKRTVH